MTKISAPASAEEQIAIVIAALRRNSFGPKAFAARQALVAAGLEPRLEAAIAAADAKPDVRRASRKADRAAEIKVLRFAAQSAAAIALQARLGGAPADVVKDLEARAAAAKAELSAAV